MPSFTNTFFFFFMYAGVLNEYDKIVGPRHTAHEPGEAMSDVSAVGIWNIWRREGGGAWGWLDIF